MFPSLTSFCCSYCHLKPSSFICFDYSCTLTSCLLSILHQPSQIHLDSFQTQETEVGYNVPLLLNILSILASQSQYGPTPESTCASTMGKDPQMLKAVSELKSIAQLECRSSQTLGCTNHLSLLQTCSRAYAKGSSCFAASHVY